jgi:hypothetical protein
MSPENTQLLYARFPALYRRAHLLPEESTMERGFECGDGWFGLVWHLSMAIEDEAVRAGIDNDSDRWPEAMQVKEKLGSLRFRLRNGTAEMQRLIDGASENSEQLCEICGAPGQVGEDRLARCSMHSGGTAG